MRHFPFKTLFFCVLLPPFAYVFSMQLLEERIQTKYERGLAEVYTGDTRQLFNGSVSLQDAVRENVDAFVAGLQLTEWGVRIQISIKTQDGTYLYPSTYDDSKPDLRARDNVAIARENYRLLDNGLIRTVDVKIEHNTAIANAILLPCVAVALIVLVFFYQRGMRLTHREDRARQEMLDELASEQQKNLSKLERLESKKASLSDEIDRMKERLEREREKASAAEDEMFDEMAALEDKINDNLALQDLQLNEIDGLKEKIRQFEKENESKGRQRLKGAGSIRKRFNTLYKNLSVDDRAVAGFVELTEELKIKAEEVIHQLNDDPGRVQIKRKVFGKKNRETVFEVIFAYKGRLYFRKIAGNRVDVLVVGTKLTQNKDLTFLDRL
jgi:predicted  nucleic acid-binding Zn-ribbon protein